MTLQPGNIESKGRKAEKSWDIIIQDKYEPNSYKHYNFEHKVENMSFAL